MLSDPIIYERLSKVFASVMDDPILLRPDLTADDVEEWDSANHINLIVATEAEFGMRFDMRELEGLQTVGDMVAVIRSKGH